MLQLILVIAVACITAYFIITSRKSKVEEISKNTPAPLNPTFDPVQPALVEEVSAKVEQVATEQEQGELKEAKKAVKKKAAPKKKATK